MTKQKLLFMAVGAPVLGLVVLVQANAQGSGSKLKASAGDASNGTTTVQMCDGRTEVQVEGLAPGGKLNRDKAKEVADLMIAEWKRNHPGQTWVMAQASPAPKTSDRDTNPAKGVSPPRPQSTQDPRPPAAAVSASDPVKPVRAAKPGASAKQSEIYNQVSNRDQFVWKSELDKFVKEGDRIFHDSDAFGGTVGISCDMCHPNAANTHPETYPKYQVQLQKVALLRDMINWCIHHPTKGKPLPDDDPRLRAMEAYIMAQRKGKVMEPGKR